MSSLCFVLVTAFDIAFNSEQYLRALKGALKCSDKLYRSNAQTVLPNINCVSAPGIKERYLYN